MLTGFADLVMVLVTILRIIQQKTNAQCSVVIRFINNKKRKIT